MQAGGLGGADLYMWWKLVGVKGDDGEETRAGWRQVSAEQTEGAGRGDITAGSWVIALMMGVTIRTRYRTGTHISPSGHSWYCSKRKWIKKMDAQKHLQNG